MRVVVCAEFTSAARKATRPFTEPPNSFALASAQAISGKAKLVVSRNTAPALRRPRSYGKRLSYATRVSSIASLRERRMNEIVSLRRDGPAPGSFVDKAQTLLTYRWSKATWRSRERILGAVDWLLRMERVHRKALADPANQLSETFQGGRR